MAASISPDGTTTLPLAPEDGVELEIPATTLPLVRWTPEEQAAYMDDLPEHPLFMTRAPTVSETDSNSYVAALTSMAYDEVDTPESCAKEAKDKGNAAFAKGAEFYGHAIKHYNDCIDHASRAKPKGRAATREMNELTSAAYSNLAAVYLARRKYKSVLDSCAKALALSPSNEKALFRACKACIAVGRASEALQYAAIASALPTLSPAGSASFEALKSEAARLLRVQESNAATSRVEAAAIMQALRRAREAAVSRGLRVGPPLFADMHRTRAAPYVDESGLLHWPLLLLYPDVGMSDYLEDVAECASVGDVLQAVTAGAPAPWDRRREYVEGNIDVFYQATPSASSASSSDSSSWWSYALEGSALRGASMDEAAIRRMGADDASEVDDGHAASSGWIRVPVGAPLLFILSQPNYVLRDVPVFLLVARSSALYGHIRDVSGGRFTELRVPASVLAAGSADAGGSDR